LLLCRLVSLTDLSIEQLSIVASDVRPWNAKSRIGFEWTHTNSDVLKSSVLIYNSVNMLVWINNCTSLVLTRWPWSTQLFCIRPC